MKVDINNKFKAFISCSLWVEKILSVYVHFKRIYNVKHETVACHFSSSFVEKTKIQDDISFCHVYEKYIILFIF